ncbi:MAG: cell division protein FtsA [Patescibacteria group bacterium]|nr:cell division protein FtsA [Patescibacteria group bacterium]
MSEKIICGIDIGSNKVCTIVGLLSQEEDEIRIIGYNQSQSRGVKKGLVVDIDEVASSVEESLEKAERMAGHKINRCFVSVGGPHVASLNSHGIVAISNPNGEIGEDDVARVIEAARAVSLSQTREIIEVVARDFIVDGQEGIKNPVGMSGVRLEVNTHIITASATNLRNINRCLTDLGIENAGFVFSGLASAEAVLTETEKELGVVLVDIGGGKTDICLYVEGALSYSSAIPVGARNITNDIAVGLRVSLDSAEKIKLYLNEIEKKGVSQWRKKTNDEFDISSLNLPEGLKEISLKTLTEGIMWPRLEEIYKLVFEEIEKSGFSESIPSGLVITGGGGLTFGIIEAGKKVLGLPIRLGMPGKVSGLVDEIIAPPYATAIGLILYGRKNIMTKEEGFRSFNRFFRDFSLNHSFEKLKSFFKQFIP